MNIYYSPITRCSLDRSLEHQKTIADLKAVERATGGSGSSGSGRVTPILVVINKVEAAGGDSGEADDVREVIEQCRRTVTVLLAEAGCSHYPVLFVPMSAQSLFLYRQAAPDNSHITSTTTEIHTYNCLCCC